MKTILKPLLILIVLLAVMFLLIQKVNSEDIQILNERFEVVYRYDTTTGLLYSKDFQQVGKIEKNGTILDRNFRFLGKIEPNGTVLDKNFNTKFYIKDSRVYDRNFQTKGYISKPRGSRK